MIANVKMIFNCLAIVFTSVVCSKPVKTAAQDPGNTMVTYTESTEDFPNPERGFYRYSETRASNYTALDLSQLREWRTGAKADGGTYSVTSSLVFRYYVLDIFKDKPLSAAFINSVRADFNIARTAGSKLIPRFTYTVSSKAGSCPEKFICPPYGDAPKEVVLGHIAQLKEVLTENADVIACVQMGFVGVWGEQYYTDHFGDASGNASAGKLLDNNWNDRIEVLRALLDAVPADRMVQVRYPQLKQRYVYGVRALTNVGALSEGEAFSGTDKARIAFHNDCFLASADDYGTYEDYGNSVSDRKSDLNILKDYKNKDSRYVVVGGETCTDDYSPQNDCEPAGIAQTEMEKMHYSFLNCAYNNDVNNDWQKDGCMEEIKRRLGYRFVLKSAGFPKSITRGETLKFNIELLNKGYASCYNPRQVKLVLRNKTTGQQTVIDTDADPRKWYSGITKWDGAVIVPAAVPAGNYEIYLSLPDKYASIGNRPEYAIRLANKDTWESATGLNKLNIVLEVK
ncbi:MAG: DUF4832 domain-containing protein [Pseudobacter sp.]|uniref:DUF4832 domain-containing protein n=1 Tax=Pseudobacter sp. TaxID=2045420 RepID=UPI003F7F6C5E